MGYASRCQELRARVLWGQVVPGLKRVMLAPPRAGGRSRRAAEPKARAPHHKRMQVWSGGGGIMKLAIRMTGGSVRVVPCRPPCGAPAPGGGACRRLSPPKERQRRSRKRHSFLSRTRLRGQIEPWIFFCEIAGGKVTVIRLTLSRAAERVARLMISGSSSVPAALCAGSLKGNSPVVGGAG